MHRFNINSAFRRVHYALAVSAGLMLAAPVTALAAPDVITQMPLDIPRTAATKVGVYIADLQTGEQLYNVNTSKLYIPASVTKALTSASALTNLSASHRFATEIVAHGRIRDGVLKGDLEVRCVGDPTIDSEHFDSTSGFADSIAAAVSACGIRQIDGTVVIDESFIPADGVPSGWVDEDIVWPYGTGHHGANYRDNKFIMAFPSQTSTPHVPDIRVAHTPGKGSLQVDRDRGSEILRTKGAVRSRGQSVELSTPVPSKVMRHAVIKALNSRGVSVGNTSFEKPKDEEQLIYIHYSPELIEILRSLMFRSDNMMAEGMLRTLSPGATRSEAVRSEMDMWELRNISTDGIVIEDGSGLSRNDRMSPEFLANVLTWMASHVKASDFVSLFPKAGMEGTMKNFLRDTPLEGRVAFKTGSMKGVQSYAGYLLADDGLPSHVVVVMVNGFSCSRAKLKEEIENMLLRTFAPDFERPKPQPPKKRKTVAKAKKSAKAHKAKSSSTRKRSRRK